MSDLASTLLFIAGLFGVLVAAKQLLKNVKYCAICLAVSVTWVGLLVLLWFGVFNNSVLVALLMGQSSLGLYYLIEKRSPERFLVFRLPLLISLTWLAYSVVNQTLFFDALLMVVGAWLVFGVLYVYRTNPKFQTKVKAVIDCCSDW